jgi:cytochrome d ubiquinol oxidase subunit II
MADIGLAEIPLIVMLVGLAAYTVLGGADFGAGLWELTARGERNSDLRDHTHRSMAPVWEANHVWLIFVLVMCWTAYPTAFASIFSTLTIPLFLAGLGVILRGAAYALRAGISSPREELAVSFTFALSSLLTPFALGTAVGGIASQRVPVGNAVGDQLSSWLNPTSLLIGTLAVAASAYLAGVYLAADARRMGDRRIADAFRRRALVAGVLAGAIAAAGPLVLREDARPLYEGLTEGAGLVALLASFVAGVAALALVWARRYEPARVAAAGAVVAVVAGWGLAQRDSFLPGLSIEEAAASDATLVAVLIGFAVGLFVLLPSLAYLFRLVLTGRFDPAVPLPSGVRDPLPPPATRGAATRARAATLLPAAAAVGIGAAVAFIADGLVRGAGVAAMLAGAVVAFLAIATLDEE